jgi:hypothetical protein
VEPSSSKGWRSSSGEVISFSCLVDRMALFLAAEDDEGTAVETGAVALAVDDGDEDRVVAGASDWRLRGRRVGIV